MSVAFTVTVDMTFMPELKVAVRVSLASVFVLSRVMVSKWLTWSNWVVRVLLSV